LGVIGGFELPNLSVMAWPMIIIIIAIIISSSGINSSAVTYQVTTSDKTKHKILKPDPQADGFKI